MALAEKRDLAVWKDHLQDEADAAFLYRRLAELELDSKRSGIYQELAEVEDRHVSIWRNLISDEGFAVPETRPSLRARLLAWFASRYGPGSLLEMLLKEEGQEVKGYLALYNQSESENPKEAALLLAKESAQHALTLSGIADKTGEPWHRIESGGFLRNVVYGFNDGLTANFGLVAGVVGASVDYRLILVTGIAGIIADALSMGSSGYLAAKSEREVYAHEIEMEKEEIKLMPELEEDELTLIYRSKGIDEDRARELASVVMKDPERALQELVREELRIGDLHTTPIKEGWVTGLATAVGALIPVAPFFFLEGKSAIVTSFAVSMLSHFVVGAIRSIFTGRSIIRSGTDMFAVGLGVAIIAYIVGDLVVRML